MTPLTEKRRAPITTRAGEVYYAQIRARGKDANHRLTLRITDGDNTIREYAYFVPIQDTDVYLPFVATGKERFCEVESCEGGGIVVDDVIVVLLGFLQGAEAAADEMCDLIFSMQV